VVGVAIEGSMPPITPPTFRESRLRPRSAEATTRGGSLPVGVAGKKGSTAPSKDPRSRGIPLAERGIVWDVGSIVGVATGGIPPIMFPMSKELRLRLSSAEASIKGASPPVEAAEPGAREGNKSPTSEPTFSVGSPRVNPALSPTDMSLVAVGNEAGVPVGSKPPISEARFKSTVGTETPACTLA
jgi:hypothetical protein